MAHVIIPTKSNLAGLSDLLLTLSVADAVDQVTVVADGPDALDRVRACDFDKLISLRVLGVPLGAGIHVMWNLGMAQTYGDDHVLFLNDDVSIDVDTISGLEDALNQHEELGLVCPRYTSYPVPNPYQEVVGTCGGRYDGSGGLGGFCMMLAADLAHEWRFDERMKWWCGDDDVLNWVRITKHRKAAITPYAVCSNNTSWTINNDPPVNFNAIVAEDLRIYQSKTY